MMSVAGDGGSEVPMASLVEEALLVGNSTHGTSSTTSDDPRALLQTFLQALGCYAFCIALRLALRCCTPLYEAAFAPKAVAGSCGASAFPGVHGAWREARVL